MDRNSWAALLCFTLGSALYGADAKENWFGEPYGIEKREAWTTSRVIGRPEPPAPYQTRRVWSNLSFAFPVYLAREPGSDRLMLVQLKGKIVYLTSPQAEKTAPFCQVADHDLYSMTFHPTYEKNHFLYVFANGPNSVTIKKNRIFRFEVKKDGCCDPNSQKLILEWESNGHNGGDMAFGPDGFLYITAGDGTSDSDENVTGQDLKDLCSGVLRIDVDHEESGKAYAIPRDNPFLRTAGARPELWVFGLRNPWRMCFDPNNGNLYVADVGQDLWEMIHLIRRGGNYGWSVYEGSHPFRLQRQRGPGPILPPIIEHPHSESRSITGGLVYTGTRLKDLRGAYIYGDYSTGKIWGIRYADGKITWKKELADSRLQIVAFGQDRKNELYIIDYSGQVHQLDPSPPDTSAKSFPKKLSETGLFSSVRENKPEKGLIPYTVNAPLWSDGALKERFIALPGSSQIDFAAEGFWGFPEGTVLVKTFSLETQQGKPSSARRIETRLLTFQKGQWHGYSYLWNEDQTDADLVSAAGADKEFTIQETSDAQGLRKQKWHYPSRVECMVCHSRAANYVLGLTTLQMNKTHAYGKNGAKNQLRTLEHLGVFRVNLVDYLQAHEDNVSVELTKFQSRVNLDAGMPLSLGSLGNKALLSSFRQMGRILNAVWTATRTHGVNRLVQTPRFVGVLPKRPSELKRLVDPRDETADLDRRVRSYLHANCAQCHVPAGGGNSAIDLHFATKTENLKILGVSPNHDRFGINKAELIAPGDPDRSILYRRLTTLGPGRMPPLASSEVDKEAARMLAAWIREMRKSDARNGKVAAN